MDKKLEDILVLAIERTGELPIVDSSKKLIEKLMEATYWLSIHRAEMAAKVRQHTKGSRQYER